MLGQQETCIVFDIPQRSSTKAIRCEFKVDKDKLFSFTYDCLSAFCNNPALRPTFVGDTISRVLRGTRLQAGERFTVITPVGSRYGFEIVEDIPSHEKVRASLVYVDERESDA